MKAREQSGWRARTWCLCLIGMLALALSGGCPTSDIAGTDGTNSGTDVADPNSSPGSNGGADPNDSADAGTSDTDNDGTTDDTDDDGDDNSADEAQRSVTITPVGEGSVDPPSGSWPEGTELTLAATAADGWQFDHWEGDLTGHTNPATVTVSADMAITAVFVRASTSSPINFYAIYNPIVDQDALGDDVGRSGDYCTSICAMSGDGLTVAFGNEYPGANRKIYLLNTDGTELVGYALPGSAGTTKSVAINQDGSRVFVSDPYASNQAIYKLEHGALATIALNTGAGSPGAASSAIYTTTDGEWVHFVAGGDIWRVRHDGSSWNKVVDDANVLCTASGYGAGIGCLAISADGSAAAFTMIVNRDYPGHTTSDAEVFVLASGTVRQLTDDGQGGTAKAGVWISGDGSTIVYTNAVDRKHIAIKPDGTGKTTLEAGDIFCHGALTYDGAVFVGFTPLALVNTDGSGVQQLFPSNWIAASDSLCINADATRIFFRFEYDDGQDKARLYMGYLNDPNAVPDAPAVGSITFSPPAVPRGDAGAQLQLDVGISDSAGVSDVTRVDAFELLDGQLQGDVARLPAYFATPRDNGQGFDSTAGDGIFTTDGLPGGSVNSVDEMTVRIGVEAADHTFVVADTVLAVGP